MQSKPVPQDQPRFHLFVSPHLDDAALSCGGQISTLAAAGHSLAIFTLMAGRPMRELPSSPILAELHARWGTTTNPVTERRWEDIKATRRLGALARHGTIPDCVYRVRYNPDGAREALYPSEESLWGAIPPDDPAILLLEATPLIYPQADVVHVPLGAGGHVDHRLVRDWGRRLARTSGQIEVCYYEEYPYTREPGAIEIGAASLCTGRTGTGPAPAGRNRAPGQDRGHRLLREPAQHLLAGSGCDGGRRTGDRRPGGWGTARRARVAGARLNAEQESANE